MEADHRNWAGQTSSARGVENIPNIILCEGMNVRVVQDFRSNNANPKCIIESGSEGCVVEIDEDGDAKIDFGRIRRHWVEWRHFGKLCIVENVDTKKGGPGKSMPQHIPNIILCEGMNVRVVQDFNSNNANRKCIIESGSTGCVVEIDGDGDAKIDFGTIRRHWVERRHFDKLTRPMSKLKTFDIQGIANYIQDYKAKRIVVLCGAGISTSVGIPDFKTLYASDRCKDLPSRTAFFEIDYFQENPSAFYALAKEIWPGGAQPSPAHYFIYLLHLKGVLLKCYTQNIDTLERQAGVPDEVCVYAHGNFDACHVVGQSWDITVDSSELKKALDNGTWEELNARKGGLVKPKISFYGESLPQRFYETRDEVKDCDLVIVLGTSLGVAPFKELVGSANSDAPRLLINADAVGKCEDLQNGFRYHLEGEGDCRDVFQDGDIDSAIRSLAAALGWGDDLSKLIASPLIGATQIQHAAWALAECSPSVPIAEPCG